MTTTRDFPATSIGRAQGTNFAPTPTLAVHPLLNPAQTTTTDSAKYVPYTPRQRLATTQLPTSQGSGRLQLANLKAAAQSAGLEANSVGWAILDKIAYEGDTSDEWSEIWNALTKAGATLLLPAEPSTIDVITLELVQDHVIWCDLSAREDTAVLTFSGMRGLLVGDTLTFRSSVHRSTKPYQGLSTPSVSRTAALDALPPLPVFPLESSYPSFTVSAFSPALPLPSRATKPPLPPRPGARGSPASSVRLSASVMSFFGGRPSTPPPTTALAAPPPTDTDATIEVPALVIDAVLSRADIATAILGALKGELAIALNDQPPWIVERVHAFSLPYLPFVKVLAGRKRLQDIGGNPNRVVYAVNGVLDKPDELADKFQAFYRAVEAELREGYHVQGDEVDVEPVEERKDEEDEARIHDALETIESALCTLLYDRLFLPSSSDDASHNEALSSRIAALNMLDLGLEHLDIDIGDADHAEVDGVVQKCGQALARLDATARSPREKAAVLVSAHKIVVDGLSTIPPIRLKCRDDADRDPVPHPPSPTGSTQVSTAPVTSIHISPTEDTQSPLLATLNLSTSPEQSSAIKPLSSETDAPSTSPVSGDVLLPLLIFSVVKANPLRLVSHLLFTQRFRNQSFGGEESYCLINLMAVAEFLENVDLRALGLGEATDKVISTADLTPIPIARPEPTMPLSGGVRSGQGVDDAIAAANKVISGVVDTSFGVLRAFLPQTVNGGDGGARPSHGRREAGFSIAGLTAAVAGTTGKGKSQVEDRQRELVEVSSSRPPSLRSHHPQDDEGEGTGSSGEESPGESEGDEDGAQEEDGVAEGNEGDEEEVHDARSIKSFESMLSGGRTKRKTNARRRLTNLTDRLTHGMAGMSRRVQQSGDSAHKVTATAAWPLPPPNQRFVECTEQDIRVSEVGELLREYQRLVEAVRCAGGFQD